MADPKEVEGGESDLPVPENAAEAQALSDQIQEEIRKEREDRDRT